ncbi:MAG: SDR family oxidoreductase [Planctomycetaceae bacterium]
MPDNHSPPTPRTLLLTGGTGLLGSYLIRDLLLDGCDLAVVARGERRSTAADRIEAIVGYWEDLLGKRLGRPTVLEGDLHAPCCGLDAGSLRWVREHCDAVLHNAASLTFRGPDRDQEPWKSNVTGTMNVLDVAREGGIRHFHHVSTAYVCGLRTDVVREDDLDVGQDFGNDYERSKVEAEQLVRGAAHLDTVTVLRPSIIVGDSRTGYTTTFHGLFAVIRLGHTLLTRVALGSTSGPAILSLLGAPADDHKNFVPVDWVASAIAHGVQTPVARGQTFHLTHPAPVSNATIGDVVQEAVERFSRAASPDDPDLCDERWFADNLATQLEVYRSYFRNDPTFDRSNTDRLFSHLPCPDLDHASLLRMAKFAIEDDFGRAPRPEPPRRAETPKPASAPAG